MLQQHGISMTSGADTTMNGMGNGMNPMTMGNYDHGFNNAPQDLWKMPMTLEWDWADMAGYAGAGYEDGISMNGVLPEYAQGNGSGMNMNNMNGHR